MYRNEKSVVDLKQIVKALNLYSCDQMKDYEFIDFVCKYFDTIKNKSFSEADKKFLKYVSTVAGVPQYFDILSDEFKQDTIINNLGISDIFSYLQDRKLYTSDKTKLHRPQLNILNLYKKDKINRFFLSASTSFGKTHLVYEILRKMEYHNILLIFPTVALLSENLEKIINNSQYEFLKDEYEVHTLSDVKNISTRNIFIYTPERFLSFLDNFKGEIIFDFLFVDEIYKIDNEFIIDENIREDERDIAYRLSTNLALKISRDVLLAGPYINLKDKDGQLIGSFSRFLKNNNIRYLDYNNYTLVAKEAVNVIKKDREYRIDNNLYTFPKGIHSKSSKYKNIIETLVCNNHENCIVYCYRKSETKKYAKYLFDLFYDYSCMNPEYKIFLEHIALRYSTKWYLYEALQKGIGVHNNLIPKYIQKEIIRLFNKGILKVITTTTTITEGVNTSAKNILITMDKKGTKPLKPFDAKNIAGRAGRFLHHYSGRIIVLENNFMDILESEDALLEHKNYDLASTKSDIDVEYTQDQYLSPHDLLRKTEIEQLAKTLPTLINEQFKIISKQDKAKIYKIIYNYTPIQKNQIEECIKKSLFDRIDYDGFNIFINSIIPIVTNKKLLGLMQHTAPTKDGKVYPILIYMLSSYLTSGFHGCIQYYINKKDQNYDQAIQNTADFVYNILKFHLVKYLGIFNLIFKYIKSQEQHCDMEETNGFDRLLSKLEYNANTNNGKIISDFGVPENIVKYIENSNDPLKATEIKKQFDEYEKNILEKILPLVQ